MPRDLLSSLTPAAPAAPSATPAVAAAQPAATTAASTQAQGRDALAGALPAWDLLPGSPFVRRIK